MKRRSATRWFSVAVRRAIVLTGLALAVAAWSSSARADIPPAQPATGNGVDLWVVRPEAAGAAGPFGGMFPGTAPFSGSGGGGASAGGGGKAFSIWHRREGDPPNMSHRATPDPLTGSVPVGGVAAGDNQLWLAYGGDRGAIASLAIVPGPLPGSIAYDRPQTREPLPAGAVPQWLAVSRSGPWVLVRVRDPKLLARIDGDEFTPPPPATQTQTAPATTAPARPPVELPALSAPASAPAATAPATQPGAVNALRLLRLHGGRWVRVDLPADWPEPAPDRPAAPAPATSPAAAPAPGLAAWLVMRRPADPAPLLLVAPPAQAGGGLREYRLDPAAPFDRPRWQQVQYQVDDTADLQPTAVAGQLIVATPVRAAAKPTVALRLLRPGLVRGVDLGTLAVEAAPAGAPWTLATAGPTVALLAPSAQGGTLWSRMDLMGQVVAASKPLEEQVNPGLAPNTDMVILVVVLSLATLVLFAFWRRDPTWNRVSLPADLALADPGSRAIAGLIDLAPGVAVAMAVVGTTDVREMFLPWFLYGGMWSAMVPAAIAVGVFVAHSLLSELFTGRTLGKWVLGLRVTTLQGTPPHVWQVLARNLLKAVELKGWPLLVLPLLSPARQRLGDLLARTVVVKPASEEEEEDDGDGEED